MCAVCQAGLATTMPVSTGTPGIAASFQIATATVQQSMNRSNLVPCSSAIPQQVPTFLTDMIRSRQAVSGGNLSPVTIDHPPQASTSPARSPQHSVSENHLCPPAPDHAQQASSSPESACQTGSCKLQPSNMPTSASQLAHISAGPISLEGLQQFMSTGKLNPRNLVDPHQSPTASSRPSRLHQSLSEGNMRLGSLATKLRGLNSES